MAFSFANKYNKTNFGIDTTDFKYVKLGDIFNDEKNGGGDVIHPVNGLYCHKSQLGDSPVIIDSQAKQLVNLGGFMGETVREILSDSEAVQTIKDGKVGYTIYEYESHGKKCYNVNFVDIK